MTATPNKLHIWGDIEPNTIRQAATTARLDIVSPHVALMPDAHVGIGSTVGSVIPTKGAVIPAAVGVDIGCGMIAARMPFTSDLLPDNLSALHHYISKVVPAGTGRGHAKPAQAAVLTDPRIPTLTLKQSETAAKQLGSLGSGNHFVEVCLDEEDRVWIVLHSGSRGIGNQLARIHIDKAKELARMAELKLEDVDLAYLSEGTPEFDAYIGAMNWAQAYALANREVMMDAVLTQMAAFIGHHIQESERINCHHNFTRKELHHALSSDPIWVTRKGAIGAATGERGIIPGSMGTSTFIVTGKGNPDSFNSASHGAGRRLSRRKAKEQLSLDTLKATMADKAWNSTQAQALLDEHPDAYKDINEVMEAQHDLVRIDHSLTQILNYKGV